MKKILFLQIKGNSCGGVWFVNKTIGEELINNNYDVEIMSIRDTHDNIKLEHDKKLKVSIINKIDNWEIVHFTDIKDAIKKFKFILSIKLILRKIVDNYKLKCDYIKLANYIKKNNFDYIISTHYQLLDAIPKRFYNRTFYEHHTSFSISYQNKYIKKYFDKYNGRVDYIWLSKTACDEAINKGYKNSTYLYNPVRFTTRKRASVTSNKKLVTLARISSEKRIDLMIKIVDDIFKEKKYNDWSLEIYGDGPLKEKINTMDYNKDKIKFMGNTDKVLDVLLTSSINLNTSLFEGFSMGILEAAVCGVPTISFYFGESISEEIIQNKTGIYVNQNDIDAYKEKLKLLMDNEKLLDEFSVNCKEYAKLFYKENIVKSWINLFEEKNHEQIKKVKKGN